MTDWIDDKPAWRVSRVGESLEYTLDVCAVCLEPFPCAKACKVSVLVPRACSVIRDLKDGGEVAFVSPGAIVATQKAPKKE